MSGGFIVGDWRVEPERGCLVAVANPGLEVRIEPKAMQVLIALAERRGEVVAKEQLIETVWQGAYVGDQVLVNAVWELRRALGDDSKRPRYIQTLPRRGYRLAAAAGGEGAGAGRIGKVAAGVVALAVLASAAFWLWPEREASSPPVTRFEIRPQSSFGPLYLPALAISPDASKLVFVAADTETRDTRLVLRRLDGLDEVPLAGTEGAHAPFFSPDGRWVGFFAGGELRTAPIDGGGPPVTLAEVGATRGADWGAGGWIYFARGSGGGLWRVAAAGGEPEPVTELERGEWTHRWPQVSPDGETLVFTAGDDAMRSGFDEAAVVAMSLLTGDRQELARGASFARFAAGRLYYVRAGRILAADFDARRLAIGLPRTALEGASWFPINGAAQVAISAAGTLAYLPGSAPWQPLRRLRWVDRSGAVEPVGDPSAETGIFYDPALSPDGRRLAVAIAEAGNSDLWVYDLERRTRSRLTDSPGEDQGPVWHPDGRRIAYYTSKAGPFQMFLIEASGAGEPRRLNKSQRSQRPECFSLDGRWLVFSRVHPETGFDLWYLDLEDEEAETERFLRTPYDELQARLSPDGAWLAYVSDESGRREVYLRRPVPEASSRWPLSAGGGEDPVWDPRGGAVYYRTPEALHRVTVAGSGAGEPEIGKPQRWLDWDFPPQLLEGEHRRAFDVDRDGSRFLVLEALQQASPPIRVVLNWARESP